MQIIPIINVKLNLRWEQNRKFTKQYLNLYMRSFNCYQTQQFWIKIDKLEKSLNVFKSKILYIIINLLMDYGVPIYHNIYMNITNNR